MTKRLAEAGRIPGITLLHPVVWERGGTFHSIRETHPHHVSAAG